MYDQNGRVTETRAKTGNAGRPERVTTATYTVSDKPSTVIDAAGNATSYGYDDADRAIQVTDVEGRITQQTYTNDNQPFETQQVVAGAPVTVKTVTYTPNGQTLKLKDGNNNVTTYGYDGFDQRLTTTYPNTQVESVAFNSSGTVASRLTRNNDSTAYLYDELNIQISKDPPGASNTVTTRYDKTGLLNLVTVNGTAVFDHDYDTAGRLTKVTRPDGKSGQWTLDAAGNRTALTYPGAPIYVVNYAYDELGRPKDVKENGTTVLAGWSYPDLLNGTMTYGNTTTRVTQHTLTGDLAQLTNALNGEAPQFNVVYNKVGQLANQRISVPAYEYSPAATTDPDRCGSRARGRFAERGRPASRQDALVARVVVRSPESARLARA